MSSDRAIDGARTRGLDLGKVARYQLRHYRMSSLDAIGSLAKWSLFVNDFLHLFLVFFCRLLF